jgi:hypothetical protein
VFRQVAISLIFTSALLVARAEGKGVLTLEKGTACRTYLSFSRYRVAGTAPDPVRDFFSRVLDGSREAPIARYDRIEDRANYSARIRTPDRFVNAYLDFLEVGGEAVFSSPAFDVRISDGRKIGFFEWLELNATEGQFRFDRVEGGKKIRLTKLSDGDARVKKIRRNFRGQYFETESAPAPYRERFAVDEGKLDERRSNSRYSVYYLGEGDNGIVERIVAKTPPYNSYVKKTYKGVLGAFNMFFEKRELRVLQNAEKMYPTEGVSVVRLKRSLFNTMWLEDVRGRSLQELMNTDRLSEWEKKYVKERLAEFDKSIDQYLRRRFPITPPDKTDLNRDIELLRQSNPTLDEVGLKAMALKNYEKWNGHPPGQWGGEVDVPISLNPLSPGFLLPLRINVGWPQVIVDPRTLHLTIIDPQ